jgi:hypothetical protein
LIVKDIIIKSAFLGLCLCLAACSEDSGDSPIQDGPSEPAPDAQPDALPDAQPEAQPDPVEEPDTAQPDSQPEPTTSCGDGNCDDGEDSESCPEDCADGCDPGLSVCLSEESLQTCVDGELITSACDVGFICLVDSCLEVICQPGQAMGCRSADELLVCNETGTGETATPCPEGDFCGFIQGSFACTNQVCRPGEVRCRGQEGTEVCAEDGTQWLPFQDCEGATQCDNGECKSLCEINSKVSSFLGCEYWSADFDNIAGGLNAATAVIISNPNPDLPAEITVTDGQGNPVTVAGWPTEVPSGELAIWPFASGAINTHTNAQLIDTDLVDGTIIVDQTFKFESSVPVTAHQFNPLVDSNVHTNDASLLLPTNAIGTEYLAMSWKHRGTGFQLRGFVAIIAVGTEPTTVSVTPTAAVVAGEDIINNTTIERIAPGETREFVLMPGQLLNIETEGPPAADLTGTEVLTSQPAIVFGGHECANVPLGFDACDHLEQQMFPVPSWGTRYVGTHFSPRDANNPQREVWRILAGQDGVIISTNPVIENVDGLTLNRGEFVEFETNVDFVLTATGPILPAQYITGTAYVGGGTGDPAFTLLVPVEQWRRDYIVLTPPAYQRGNFLNIATTLGSTVLLDGEPVDENLFVPLEGGQYMAAIVPVEEGPHNLSSANPFTVIAYGYDSAVSYAYPGGLNLEAVRR